MSYSMAEEMRSAPRERREPDDDRRDEPVIHSEECDCEECQRAHPETFCGPWCEDEPCLACRERAVGLRLFWWEEEMIETTEDSDV